uniref:ubiquitinyl hydrolase 1 n=1 Tax=Acrobeloides nanus TaxID=290746 RepID=A0A914CBM2_9BILA
MKKNSVKSHLLGTHVAAHQQQPREAWSQPVELSSYSSTSTNGNNGHYDSENGESSTCSTLNKKTLRAPAYAFILPNLEKYPDDFRRFLERDMIEMATLRRLEISGHLNWWCTQNNNQKLWPLVTTGDGNCLLHAASLGIWGVHDRQLHLRKTLHDVLRNGSRRHAFWRRWRWSESKANLQAELVLSEEEWAKEWNGVLEMAGSTPRANQTNENGIAKNASNEQIYESLECIHVFALAHILKRPIIVVSDTVLRNANGEELSPIPFGGIYLPLECPAEQCHRSPLVLCYDSSHFSALVAMRQSSSNTLQAIPINDKNRNLLPVHFAVDPGPDFTWWRDAEDTRIAAELEAQQTDDYHLDLIGRYMDIVKMDLRRGSIKKTLPVTNGDDQVPIPSKFLTLASGGHVPTGVQKNSDKAAPSRILKEIKQHFRWLGRRSSKNAKHGNFQRPTFNAAELRQTNCVLTVLLHNYAHQYIDSMVNNYIDSAKERYEKMKSVPATFTPKNRMSRSFSSSSVLLTCLNTHCQKTASPSTNFLCSMCFEDQKREMASIGSISTEPSTSNGISQNGHLKSSTMPAISTTLNGINGNLHVAKIVVDKFYDDGPETFMDDDEVFSDHENGYVNNRTNGFHRLQNSVSPNANNHQRAAYLPKPQLPPKPRNYASQNGTSHPHKLQNGSTKSMQNGTYIPITKTHIQISPDPAVVIQQKICSPVANSNGVKTKYSTNGVTFYYNEAARS